MFFFDKMSHVDFMNSVIDEYDITRGLVQISDIPLAWPVIGAKGRGGRLIGQGEGP